MSSRSEYHKTLTSIRYRANLVLVTTARGKREVAAKATTSEAERGPGYWVGKGLATVGVWAGCTFLGYLGIVILIGPIIALIAGVVGTMAIWCPHLLKDRW